MRLLVSVVVVVMSVSCADRQEDADQPLDTAPTVDVMAPADSAVPDSIMARDTARLPAER